MLLCVLRCCISALIVSNDRKVALVFGLWYTGLLNPWRSRITRRLCAICVGVRFTGANSGEVSKPLQQIKTTLHSCNTIIKAVRSSCFGSDRLKPVYGDMNGWKGLSLTDINDSFSIWRCNITLAYTSNVADSVVVHHIFCAIWETNVLIITHVQVCTAYIKQKKAETHSYVNVSLITGCVTLACYFLFLFW